MNCGFKRFVSSMAPVKGMRDLLGADAWRYRIVDVIMAL